MKEPIEELYFEWLCKQVVRDRGQDVLFPYTIVCGLMHEITFNGRVPNDDNRSAEGRDLRFEFLENLDWRTAYVGESWQKFLVTDGTLFEVLIALARRCDFQVELGVGEWFFIFLKNLTLERASNNDFALEHKTAIRRILLKFNDRRYSARGTGSIFPLKRAPKDMRKLELWYQMSAYIIENQMIR